MTLGAIEAFQAANRDLVPMTGEDNNGLMKAWNSLGAEGIGCAKPTWLARVAIENAVKMMNGETVEKNQIYPVQTIKTKTFRTMCRPTCLTTSGAARKCLRKCFSRSSSNLSTGGKEGWAHPSFPFS